MKKIHARTMEEREEVIFNEDGQPIGPTAKVVSGFSLFLGTLARNATFCPLIYTNWSKMPKKNRRRCWRYSQRKYILLAEARKWVVTIIREAWRRYKYKLKKKHFSEYSNMTERLKHRPPKVPEAHFKNLCEYWTKEDIQQGINEDDEEDDGVRDEEDGGVSDDSQEDDNNDDDGISAEFQDDDISDEEDDEDDDDDEFDKLK